MNLRNFYLFIILTMRFIHHQCHDFEVMQPQNQTVNPDNSASISCEHKVLDSSVEDVRLNRISPEGQISNICQKEKTNCKDVLMYNDSSNKYIFILLNIGPEEMMATYQCEITLKKDDVDITEKGKPTQLLYGEKNITEQCDPPIPLPPQSSQLMWIFIGLLALMFLYSSIITCLYIRLVMNINNDCEDSTYVEMRKPPLPRSQHYELYSMYCS